MKKKFAIVLLSLFLVVSLPFAAHANIVTATGKYIINVVKKLPGHTRVEATNTVTGAKHVIQHGVSSNALSQGIAAGVIQFGVAGGLGIAFELITGVALDAVDWVMDPANNQIKWKKKGEGAGDPAAGGGVYVDYDGKIYYNPTDFCRAYSLKDKPDISASALAAVYGEVSSTRESFLCYRPGGRFLGYPVSGYVGDAGDTGAGDEYKYIFIDQVAQKVIEQADAGQVDSQKTIEDYVTNLAKEGKLDAELDASTDITKPDEPTKPDDKDKDCPIGTTKEGEVCVKPAPDNVPLFCNQSDFTRKICDWIDWTQEKPDDLKPDAGKVDVIDKSKDLTINENRIDFSNQCPPPTPINLTVMGFGYTEELSYQPMCDFFAMLNPFIVGMGGISSALIIAGGVRRG